MESVFIAHSLQIARQPVFCENIHFFCTICLNRWKESSKELYIEEPSFEQDPPHGTDCPVCRTIGLFTEDTEMTKIISAKEVNCLEDKCTWTGELTAYDEHYRIKHTIREPSPRKLRSSESTTGRVTYHY